ncbi:gamma-glutamyltransferase [Oecophyllibacter saccharovorans]|uniref:Gamma-glutamyltranspeptidase n=1 Tax=Oecophyllibacter saccharovorans TaxID=2558360 RepID=A0A506UMY1_9PROT|nr:gamma-glutamyltransferase [Oecophyllibacter saccharovorans]TPW34483.1 gamma-glutamyltranspeptidase [Oecophyllibacter saccharovorans]
MRPASFRSFLSRSVTYCLSCGQLKQRLASLSLASLVSLGLGGCSTVHSLKYHLFGPTAHDVNSPQSGLVVADEPQAALVGRDVLARGGNAADAAAATAMALSVTLPSRASLGGGGACLVSRPGHAPETLTFMEEPGNSAPAARISGSRGARLADGVSLRPASVPMLPRGVYLLQDRYGSVQFNDIVAPAVVLADQGVTVSEALAQDLAAVKGPLLGDPALAEIFQRRDGGILGAGDQLVQKRLGAFLTRLGLVGVGDLYNGVLGSVFVTQADLAGGALTSEAMRRAVPGGSKALHARRDGWEGLFLTPPADGGLGTAMAWARGVPAEAAVATWRSSGQQGYDAAQNFLENGQVTGGSLPPLPASTSFVVADGHGMAVACALSEDNLFGTGRMAGSTGVILGASPVLYPKPMITGAVLRDRNGALRGVVAASGQNDAAQAAADALNAITAGTAVGQPTSSGRVNAIICAHGDTHSCTGTADARGHGLVSSAQPH